jgi:hypothetical protein
LINAPAHFAACIDDKQVKKVITKANILQTNVKKQIFERNFSRTVISVFGCVTLLDLLDVSSCETHSEDVSETFLPGSIKRIDP